MTSKPATPTAQSAFERDGFYLHRQPVFSGDLIRRAVEGIDAVREGRYDTGRTPEPSPWSPGDDPAQLCKIEMAHVANKALLEVVGHADLGRLAAEVTGADTVQVWWLQLLYKPSLAAGVAGTTVGWHQDRQYWNEWEADSRLLTAWVALSDVTSDTGPMSFVPGSHRWGLLNQGDFYGQSLEELRDGIDLPAAARWEEVEATLPPGGVSFHHDLTFHGSGPNTSGLPRLSLAVHLSVGPKPKKSGGFLTRFIDDPTYCPTIYGADA